MAPPYVLRADPSWDVIDLAIDHQNLAARAALRHARKRHEDVLTQLEELLEYYRHHNLLLPPSASAPRPSATTSQQQQQQQQQPQQREQSQREATGPKSTSSSLAAVPVDAGGTRSLSSNATTANNRLRNRQFFTETSSSSKINQRASSYTSVDFYTRSEFNPVPRGVSGRNRGKNLKQDDDNEDTSPRPTTRLRCGTASFVNSGNNNNNIASVSPASNTSNSNHQHQNQTEIGDHNNEEEERNAAVASLLDAARSISSHNAGNTEQYFYNSGRPSPQTPSRPERRDVNENENETNSAEVEHKSAENDEHRKSVASDDDDDDDNNKKEKRQNRISTWRSVSSTTRRTIKITEIVIDDDQVGEESGENDADETRDQKWTHEEDFTRNEKPARTDSASPLPYQRRPLHHHHDHQNSGNARTHATSRKLSKLRAKSASQDLQQQHQQQEQVDLATTSFDTYIGVNSDEAHLQRGFSLTKTTISLSPQRQQHQRKWGAQQSSPQNHNSPISQSRQSINNASPSIRRFGQWCGIIASDNNNDNVDSAKLVYRGVGDICTHSHIKSSSSPTGKGRMSNASTKRHRCMNNGRHRDFTLLSKESLVAFGLSGLIVYGVFRSGVVEL